MGKLDTLKQSAGANVLASTVANRETAAGQGHAVGPPSRWKGVNRAKDAVTIPLDRIVPDPDQPRTEFDPEALERLADSLRIRGQLQPIRVRWDDAVGAYVILVGERRWRAARLAGLAELLCVVVEGEIAAEERLMIQLVENALREDLRPVEQAKAYRALMDARGWSGNQLAKELHIGQASVVRALSLLELPAPVQAQVEAGELASTVAHEIARVEGGEAQEAIASAVIERGLNRGEVEDLVRAVRARKPTPEPRPAPVTLDLDDGVTVTVKWRKASSVSVVQALRKALRAAQERDRSDGQAA